MRVFGGPRAGSAVTEDMTRDVRAQRVTRQFDEQPPTRPRKSRDGDVLAAVAVIADRAGPWRVRRAGEADEPRSRFGTRRVDELFVAGPAAYLQLIGHEPCNKQHPQKPARPYLLVEKDCASLRERHRDDQAPADPLSLAVTPDGARSEPHPAMSMPRVRSPVTSFRPRFGARIVTPPPASSVSSPGWGGARKA
jgi:hypothetical protein